MSPTNNPLPLIPTYAGMPSSILWDMLNNIHGPSTIPSSVSNQQSLLLEDGWEIPYSLGTTPNCVDTSRIENCLENLLIQIGNNSQVFHMLSERVLQALSLTKYSDDVCILPGDNYPYWLTFMREELL
ncbi:hypothetical protein K1719_036354 [Acacia pycnantha]|nr:hypothetical protein K1719_036354 [Acacia pycnantha]